MFRRAPWRLLAALAASSTATAQGPTCDDIEFTASATAEFPSAAQSCHSVVERSDGRLYVRIVAEVVSVRPDGSLLLDLLGRDGSSTRLELAPPRGFRAIINGRPRPTRDLVRGQQIRLYLPPDRWRLAEAAPE